MQVKLDFALEKLRQGAFVLVYDDGRREGETDLVMLARHATPQTIRFMRKNGGLICIAVDGGVAAGLGLSFYTKLLRETGYDDVTISKTPYGDEPAFALTVNHKDTYTGIIDIDRAKTISEFGRMADDSERAFGRKEFAEKFYAPGHVYVLIGRGVEKRKGHTELSLWLASRCGSRATAICELLGDDGRALSPQDAEKMAQENGTVLLTGEEILKATELEKK